MEKRLIHEIEHGRYLAEKGAGEVWNWEGAAGHRRWARRVEMLVAEIGKESRVLELGCGTGYFTRELVKRSGAVTAIDISPDLLERARGAVAGATFALENAYAMSFRDATFDMVVGSSVLHHLDVDRALGEVFRVLKEGGTLAFTEPNMLNPQIAIQKNVAPIKKWLGDSPDETAFFKWKLSKRLKQHGFVDVQVMPFDFLHPKLPPRVVPAMERFCGWLESIPVIREIAGSLYIRAAKPGNPN